jgi:hypothetical protein
MKDADQRGGQECQHRQVVDDEGEEAVEVAGADPAICRC